MKPIPDRFKKSNTDEKGLPLRIDLGGVRDESKPYARAKFKLIYVPGKGATFVRTDTEVKTLQPSDFCL
jgi:hypothetical protein